LVTPPPFLSSLVENRMLMMSDERFSFVFPNTALVTATLAIGKSLESSAIQIFGTVLSCLLIVVWFFVWAMMIRALWLRRLLWPGEMDGSEVSLKKWASSRHGHGNGNHLGGIFQRRIERV
jgi:hypothetical protein